MRINKPTFDPVGVVHKTGIIGYKHGTTMEGGKGILNVVGETPTDRKESSDCYLLKEYCKL